MKLHGKVSLSVVALIILAGLATETFASCVLIEQGPPCQEFWRASAVFIGTAARVEHVRNETQLALGPYLRSTTHLSVEEAFKGVEGTVVVVDSNDCPYLFKEGERYLVYAHYNSSAKKFEVRVGFTRTRPLSEAGEDLAYLRSLPSAQAGSRIFGKVLQQGFKDSKSEIQPLRGTRVSLVSNDETREVVVTDGEGRYEFKNLAAGTYRIRLEVPSYLVYREDTINSGDHGCVPLDLFAIYKGRINGRVLDTNGKPVPEVPLTLVSADAKREDILSEGKERSPGITVYSNRDGTYSFSQLMPGRYLVIVNRRDFAGSGSEVVRNLPPLFYPGVNDPGAATVIVLTNDQKPQEYDFVLPLQQ
jgi:hypothetical protein